MSILPSEKTWKWWQEHHNEHRYNPYQYDIPSALEAYTQFRLAEASNANTHGGEIAPESTEQSPKKGDNQ